MPHRPSARWFSGGCPCPSCGGRLAWSVLSVSWPLRPKGHEIHFSKNSRCAQPLGSGAGRNGPCLERSLTLHRVLGRAGAAPTLVCGMAHGSQGFVGHAWVEVDDEPLAESQDPRGAYAIVARYSANGERIRPQATEV